MNAQTCATPAREDRAARRRCKKQRSSGSKRPRAPTIGESQRDSVTKPRVARNELPWVKASKGRQPQRGCVSRDAVCYNSVGVGKLVHNSPQGSSFFATVGWRL